MKIIQLYILLLSSFRFLVTSGTWQTEEFVFELNKDQKQRLKQFIGIWDQDRRV